MNITPACPTSRWAPTISRPPPPLRSHAGRLGLPTRAGASRRHRLRPRLSGVLAAGADRRPAGLARQRHARRFFATSKQQVDEFHRQALLAGAADEGAPGSRPHYGEAYYGCFVRDLDGHKIEASFWDESAA